jgi:hypothetical protein
MIPYRGTWSECLKAPWRRREIATARARWNEHQAELQEVYFSQAGSAGTPRGLHWRKIEWPGTMQLARERSTGLLTAFVGVVVHFEPVEGGEMEGVEAATLPRDATAVFHFRRGRWGTGGRTLFNMTPEEALVRLANQFEAVEER